MWEMVVSFWIPKIFEWTKSNTYHCIMCIVSFKKAFCSDSASCSRRGIWCLLFRSFIQLYSTVSLQQKWTHTHTHLTTHMPRTGTANKIWYILFTTWRFICGMSRTSLEYPWILWIILHEATWNNFVQAKAWDLSEAPKVTPFPFLAS